jgi:polysaccharide deacetylase family protein (PEP-CTERM system associated)
MNSGPPTLNAFTVDVEEHFHATALARCAAGRWDTLESRVVANTDTILAILDDAHVRGTFFVLGWVAERQPDLVRRIAACGHEIASHGFAHELVYRQSPAEFAADVRRSKQVLEDICGEAVTGYRAPSYSVTRRSLWALDVLLDVGFQYDASIFPVYHDLYGIPDAPRGVHRIRTSRGTLIEAPPTTVRLAGVNVPIAGGGYFRLFPYWWTRLAMRYAVRRDAFPILFYVHPWEIDADQPRLPCGIVSRFRHYRALRKTSGRLQRLLRDFRFGTMRDVLSAAVGVGVAEHAYPERVGATQPERADLECGSL